MPRLLALVRKTGPDPNAPMVSLPRYPKYKDSGVEWLGEVPDHWELVPLKRIAGLRSGDSISADDISATGDYAVYGGNGIRGYTSPYTHEGDFVLIGRQGALCGNVTYAVGRFWASEHAVVASPLPPVSTIWLGEMLRAMDLNQYSVTAAQPGLSVDVVANLRTVLPPLEEQVTIGSFLEHETAKIDALISEQRRLVESLKEQRQAVISQAVTKGLNADTPMKSSGIEWLGELPDHWTVSGTREQGTPGDAPTNAGIRSSQRRRLMSRSSGSLDVVGSTGRHEDWH